MHDSPAQRAAQVRNVLPSLNFFQAAALRISPSPFPLSASQVDKLWRLGDALHRFERACNLLYRYSIEQKAPSFIATWLDQGLAPDLVNWQQAGRTKGQVPVVLRPTLAFVEGEFVLREPWGLTPEIGLSAWMQETYARFAYDVLGGPGGIRADFAAVFPEGDLVLGKQNAHYRKSLSWLVGEERVHEVLTYAFCPPQPVYRIFSELEYVGASQKPQLSITPPLKPFLRNPLWWALYHLRPLRETWRRLLSEKTQRLLDSVIPPAWILDPSPLPPSAVIPGLEIHQWLHLTELPPEQDFIIANSSLDPSPCWLRRAELSEAEWQQAVTIALEQFSTQPSVLISLHRPRAVNHDWVDLDQGGTLHTMQGSCSVQPYYTINREAGRKERLRLSGATVTIRSMENPEHAIIVPASEQ